MKSKPLICIGLLGITFLSMGYVCVCDFVFLDDPDYVSNNPHVLTGLSAENLRWAFTDSAPYGGFWFPLVWLSFQTDAALFGTHAWGFHLTNLLIHSASVLLFFLTLQRVTLQLWRSAAAAALFAIHPLRVESVAWITERKDVLGMLFLLLTVVAYVWYCQRPGWQRYSALLTCYALGLMSKITVITLPFALLLLDYWPLYRLRLDQKIPPGQAGKPAIGWQWLIAEKIPLLVGALGILAVDYHLLSRADSVASSTLAQRLGIALAGYLCYLEKTFWPANLAVIYPANSVWLGYSILSPIVLVAISVLVFRLRRDLPFLIVGWLWFLGTLVPFSGIVQIGPQVMADRFAYIPHLGLMIMLVWGVSSLGFWQRCTLAVKRGVVAIVVGVLMFLTALQVMCWHDSELLFRHSIANTTNNAFLHFVLGNYYHQHNDLDSAIFHYGTSCQFEPTSDRLRAYATALILAGYNMKAKSQAQSALAVEEKQDKHKLKKSADNQYIFALACSNLGDWTTARLHLDKALDEQETTYAPLHANINKAGVRRLLGDCLLRDGRLQEAVKQYSLSLEFKPDETATHESLGIALGRLGQWQAAEARFRDAVNRQPNSSFARGYLAYACKRGGKPETADEEYVELLRLAPNWPNTASAEAMDLITKPEKLDPPTARELAQQVIEATNATDGAFADARQTANRVLMMSKAAKQ